MTRRNEKRASGGVARMIAQVGMMVIAPIWMTPATPVRAQSSKPPQPPIKRPAWSERRMVQFPEDRSLGTLAIRPVVARPSEDEDNWIPLEDPAQGGIWIPPYRELALWVGPDEVANLSYLPNLHPATFASVRIRHARLDEKTLSSLRHLTYLEDLDLRWSTMSDDALAPLTEIKSLKILRLRGTPLTDHAMTHVAKLENLETLDLPEGIGKAGLVKLAEMKTLRSLDVSNNSHIDDEAVKVIGTLSGLRSLDLSDTAVTDEGMKYLASLKRLEHLDLARTAIGDKGPAALSEYRLLWDLNLSGTRVGDEGLKNLSKVETLEKLNLANTKVTDRGLSHLSRMMVLEDLSLSGAGVTAEGMASLAALPSLSSLSLHGTQVDDRACDHFEKMRELRRLVLKETRVSEAAVKRLKEKLPRCKILH